MNSLGQRGGNGIELLTGDATDPLIPTTVPRRCCLPLTIP
jgi:hypothetical protein